jgi:F0F1-type ATP synthase membrane subunit c/vacuolar-type H+-ATPase subunit K
LEKILIAVIVLVSVLGPSGVIASVGYAAIKAVGRNPSSAPKVLIPMLVAFAFAEALGIVSLLVAFQVFR